VLILINGWESKRGLDPSEPQVFVGDKTAAWLSVLEKRVPSVATAKVGRPAIAGDAVEAARQRLTNYGETTIRTT
jgi:hypothetical protein